MEEPTEWKSLHDATFLGIEFEWATGLAVLKIAAGVAGDKQIRCEGVLNLQCARRHPWGESEFINKAVVHHERRVHRLILELQSGDEVEIVGSRIVLL